MFTKTLHNALVAHAGQGFTWTHGDKYGTRPRSDARQGLRAYLYDYADGLCAFCERPAEELAHIVATGPMDNGQGMRIRRGWIPGNIAPSCHACNEDQAHRYGAIVPMSAITHPERIATVWPTETELRRAGQALMAARVA